ncbi:MAG: crossover junction endodeoxyribonuclease RuvC [Candidatus Kapaibacterium sp.]
MIILGIDPGSVNCGWGVISAADDGALRVVEYGVIRAKKADANMPGRLKEIYTRLGQVIHRNRPDCAVFESAFYSRNVQSLMKLSHARAAAVLATVMEDIAIEEYTPREVKKSVTGRGNAGKEQVDFMVRRMLGIKESPEFFDATDALAVAICYSIKRRSPKNSAGSWEDFLKKNSARIVDPNK